MTLSGIIKPAAGGGFGSLWTSSLTPVSGVLDRSCCPDRLTRGPAMLQTLIASTVNVGILQISPEGVLLLSLPRMDGLPGWVDLSAMSWDITHPAGLRTPHRISGTS